MIYFSINTTVHFFHLTLVPECVSDISQVEKYWSVSKQRPFESQTCGVPVTMIDIPDSPAQNSLKLRSCCVCECVMMP